MKETPKNIMMFILAAILVLFVSPFIFALYIKLIDYLFTKMGLA